MNLKTKTNTVKQILAKVMLFIMILSLISITGCEFVLSNTIENQPNTNTPEHHEPEDLINGMLAKMQAAGYAASKGIAEMYFKSSAISAFYGYPVEIIDGNIYICDFVFNDVIYVTDYSFGYEEITLSSVMSESKEKYDMLLKIQNRSGCYILKSEKETGIGDKIVIYEIDDEYYFLTLYRGYDVVKTIHKMTIE